MAWDAPDERDPETGATLFAHVYLLPQKGIYIIENLALDELARDRVREFAFVGIPLKLRGATGSPLGPLALVYARRSPAHRTPGERIPQLRRPGVRDRRAGASNGESATPGKS